MSRPSRVRAIALFAFLAAAGCQDYNFNPVDHCILQPDTKRVTLSDITTADVLFVVDDSGSMAAEQQKLADNFDDFIARLDDANQARVALDLEPFDFHIAVTTTSVFQNSYADAKCRSDCPNAASGSVCCILAANDAPLGPMLTVRKCTGPTDTSCGSQQCRDDCRTFLGEYVCCDGTTKVPALTQQVACTSENAENDPCGTLQTHYRFTSSCTAGSAAGQDQRPYPAGSFVSSGTNPRVLHFDKELYTCTSSPCVNRQGFTSQQLQDFFAQNVVVGTCGSDQEQPLQAARLAVEKAIASRQFDTRTLTGAPADPLNPPVADWLQGESKLVIVFVGDEDDCSSPAHRTEGIVLQRRQRLPPPADPPQMQEPTPDACVTDAGQRRFGVDEFVEFFTRLPGNRPVGAAVIASATSDGSNIFCEDATCVANYCCDDACALTESGGMNLCMSETCGGQAKGHRLIDTFTQLRREGADVVAGSVCDPNFSQILIRIAEIVKPPIGLLLPTQPAAEAVSVLRIAGSDGTTRKTCSGPAPAEMTAAQARIAGYDWWFTASRDQLTEEQQAPTAASRFVYINHDTRNCEADHGETYSADYLGLLPPLGCSGATAAEADDDCAATFGGSRDDWTCFRVDAEDYCTVPTGGGVVGTCLCGKRHDPPPDDSCTPGAANRPGLGNCQWGCASADEYCPRREKTCPP